MPRTILSIVAAGLALIAAAATSSVSAQTIAAKGPVVYGHHRTTISIPRDMAAQRRFFVDTLGGKARHNRHQQHRSHRVPERVPVLPADAEADRRHDRQHGEPRRFSVPDLKPVVAKLKANGYKMITSESVAPTVKVTDDIAAASPTTNIAFALGPEDIKVELVEVKGAAGTDSAAPRPLLRRAEHGDAGVVREDVRRRGAAARSGPGVRDGQLPGVTLSFSPSPTPTVATQGRALDHIGFEVKNLEAFTKKLEADGIPLTVAYRKVAALGISIAFIKDPWGTNIELTEGLAKIK